MKGIRGKRTMRTLSRYGIAVVAVTLLSTTGIVGDALAQDCKPQVKAKFEKDLI
jgi:hypothetical protein